ncbi:MAG: hypothetical protein V4638_04380 [Bacteroidota bacterium]
MRSALFFGLLFLFISCGKKVSSNQEFSLKYGKSVFVTLSNGDQLKITFDKSEESRCAPNVQCIWEGFANVVLSINQEEDSLGLLQSPHPSSVSHGNFEIKLLELNYPSDEDFGKQEKAKITLKVVE